MITGLIYNKLGSTAYREYKWPISRFPPVSDAPVTPRRDRDSPLMGLPEGRVPSDSVLS